MAKKPVKRDIEANALIQTLVKEGASVKEILTTLKQKGFQGIKASRVGYYVYAAPKRKTMTGQTASTKAAAGPTSATTVNFKRLKSILTADFLTDDDKAMLIRKEVGK